MDIGLNKKEPHYNTSEFTAAAQHFNEYGTYTRYPVNTSQSSQWYKFWVEEARRCLWGYNIGRDEIPGYFYWYLNYCRIEKAIKIDEKNILPDNALSYKTEMGVQFGDEFSVVPPDKLDYDGIRGERVTDFPDFWDSDYNFFWYLEECERRGLHGAVIKTRGRGYLQPHSETIMTPYGETTMGEININDYVIGIDGKPAKVLEKYYHGLQDVYEVEFNDGRKVNCGKDHLWLIYDKSLRNKRNIVYTTEYMINKGLYKLYNNYPHYKFYVPNIEEIKYDEKELPIDPYLLGLLLGDGSMSTGSIKIATSDNEILESIQNIIGDKYELIYDKSTTNNHLIKIKDQYIQENGYKRVNPLKTAIVKLGLNKSCRNKFIPNIYKYASVDQRMELLRGLMDTDGYINNHGGIEFTTCNDKLRDDVLYLLRSLGIQCSFGIDDRIGLHVMPSNYISQRSKTYRIYIRTNKKIFKLSRKYNRIKKIKRFAGNAIINIKKLDEAEEASCILVDNKSHTYLTRNYIPTHNSFKGAGMLNRNFYLIPQSKSYAFASEKEYLIADGLLTKAWDMMGHVEVNTPWGKRKSKVDTMLHKRASYIRTSKGIQSELGFGSEIIGVSFKNNIDKGRGKRGKLILWEEAGKFPELLPAWNISLRSMAQGRIVFGLMVAFGTGGTDTEDLMGLEQLWTRGDGYKVCLIPNIYEPELGYDKVGFFVGEQDNHEIATDKDGNSNKTIAFKYIEEDRKKHLEKTKNREMHLRYCAEAPIKPSEALMQISNNIFPIDLLKQHKAYLLSHRNILDQAWVGDLVMNSETGKIEWVIDDNAMPIDHYPHNDLININGAIVIYEPPITNRDGIVPPGLYISGNDNYDHDQSTTDSLGSTLIMSRLTERIVAEYTGRPAVASTFYRKNMYMLMYYNAMQNFENNLQGLRGDARKNHWENYLCDTPEIIKDKIDDKRVLLRGKGTPGTTPIIKYGLELILDWLMREAEPGTGVLNLHKIKSIPLIDELIYYNSKGNFDRIMALIYLLIFHEDKFNHTVNIDYSPKKELHPFFANNPLIKHNKSSNKIIIDNRAFRITNK